MNGHEYANIGNMIYIHIYVHNIYRMNNNIFHPVHANDWLFRRWIRNLYIFSEENAFENIVCEMAAVLSQPQYVNMALAVLTGYW